MKNFNVLKILLLIVVVAIAVSFLVAPVSAKSEAAKETVSISGMVEQNADGLFIKADEGDYLVIGQDLSQMIGKKVKATGELIQKGSEKTIDIWNVEEIMEKRP